MPFLISLELHFLSSCIFLHAVAFPFSTILLFRNTPKCSHVTHYAYIYILLLFLLKKFLHFLVNICTYIYFPSPFSFSIYIIFLLFHINEFTSFFSFSIPTFFFCSFLSPFSFLIYIFFLLFLIQTSCSLFFFFLSL